MDYGLLKPEECAQNVVNQLREIQYEAHKLRVQQVANGHDDDHIVPGSPPKVVDGTIIIEDGAPVFPTYAEKFAEHEDALDRLRTEFADLMPLIDSVAQPQVDET